MISNQIKYFRQQKGLTQKELANHLHVTAQAVSRWELGTVEPSLDTINEMAKFFGISVDELVNGERTKSAHAALNENKIREISKQVAKETAKQIHIPEQKPVLTICNKCKRPIYESSQIVSIRKGSTNCYICSDCDKKDKEAKRKHAIWYGTNQRKRSFGWGGALAGITLLIGCLYMLIARKHFSVAIPLTIVAPILVFTFISCLFLKNNFIGTVFLEIVSWGFVKFPGLIFSFDLDGFAWLIAMKILFAILGFFIGLAAVCLALLVCLPLSAFVYPYAIKKSIRHPELTEQ